MTRQRALRLAREWAQSHKCTLRDGEAAEYHSMFAAMLEESMPNEPLTFEELREMDEEPVYVVPKDKPAHCGGWCGVTVWQRDRYSYVSLLRDADSGWEFEEYGKTWIAYRRPPEGGNDVS